MTTRMKESIMLHRTHNKTLKVLIKYYLEDSERVRSMTIDGIFLRLVRLRWYNTPSGLKGTLYWSPSGVGNLSKVGSRVCETSPLSSKTIRDEFNV